MKTWRVGEESEDLEGGGGGCEDLEGGGGERNR